MIRCATCLALALALTVLASCGGSSPDASTPDGAAKVLTGALKAKDIRAMVHAALPPAEFAEAAAKWEAERKKPAKDSEKAQFAVVMGMLTAPNAEQTLFDMAKPQLADVQKSLGFGAMMLSGMLAGATANDKLTPEEQKQTQEVLAALSGWVMTLRIDDEAKLKQAIAIATATARSLKLATMDEVSALPFDQLLDKVSVVYGGAAKILAVYGLDVQSTVESITFAPAKIDGGIAKVPVTMTFLGKQLTATSVLRLVGGTWYPESKKP